MTTHGELSVFNPAKKHWTTYIERICNYFSANHVIVMRSVQFCFQAVDLRSTRQFTV